MEITGYDKISQLEPLSDAWDRLAETGLYFVPSFSELRHELEVNRSEFRLLIAIDETQIIAMACFIFGSATKRYEIATRKLLSLPVRVVTLFGSCVLGNPDETVVRQFFHLIIQGPDFDLINIGEIFVDSPLYRAITHLPHGVIAWRTTRKNKIWWLIQLPRSFDEYIASLRETAKAHILRDCRKFDRANPHFRVLTSAEEVDIFLRDAEKVSRQTYQWNLGYGLRNDENTRQELIRLAKNGTLRCYIIYIQDKPCAFGWGQLSHRKFLFRQTGYDPQYRKLSPGSALIMRMIRDLIENTNCKVFDFLWGDEDGYKSRFGNTRLSCASMQAAKIVRPYPLFIASLDHALNLAKTLLGLFVERGPLKKRLRGTRRRHGIGTF